jgi:FtsP/CotA-like multicopper oxidase with cupredoxin domain
VASAVRLQHQAIEVFADYHQFYLWDRGMTAEAPEDDTAEDVGRRIKTGLYVVAVQTERDSTVPVEVEIHDADPGFDPAAWDHIAEASLHLPTGRLQVHECTGGPVAEIKVEPGWYRLRSAHGGLAAVNRRTSEGGDHYQVIMWPAPPAEPQVHKQWVSEL